MKYTALILLITCMAAMAVNAQQKPLNCGPRVTRITDTTGGADSLIIPIPGNTVACKGDKIAYLVVKKTQNVQGVSQKAAENIPVRSPFLRVHGNILYDVYYRSRIDTPYAEKDVYQHTVQTYLDITVKDQYPMRVYLTTRFSNSSYFSNFSDINFQFNQPDFNRQIKEQIKNKLMERIALKDTSALHALLKKNLKDLNDLQDWLKDPAVAERIVEEREREVLKRKQAAPPAPTDSAGGKGLPEYIGLMKGLSSGHRFSALEKSKDSVLTNTGKKDTVYTSRLDSLEKVEEPMAEKYEHARKLLDSLKIKVQDQQRQYEKLKQERNTSAGSRADIDNIETVPQLKEKLQSLKIADTLLPKGYKTLFALKTFGIGRNILDYSALTARNISVTGVQVEYNPSYYVAVASGFVDYRFRDYIVQPSGPRQYATVLRFGRGMKEGNHLIFSYYFGRRQLYNSATSTQTATPNYNLVGYSLEGQYKINKTTFLVGEIAKSSLPYYNSYNNKGTLLSQAVTFNDHSNMAYRLQLQSYIPATYTRITGSYQYAGSNFQSFSVFTSGAAQTNWMARVEQPFFNRHLNIVASVRTNDYVNPYIGYSFSGNTVFKSIQATLRLRNWPTLSVGYYPSSQLTRLSETQYYENQFYTLVGTMTHFYRWKKLSMNSTLVYSRFYNRATDSNFVYFNTRNWLFSQSIFINRFTWLLNLSESANNDYTLYGAEGGCRYKVKKWLSVQGGLKYNHQTVYNREVWGYSGGLSLKVPKLGEIQCTMDKGFIPGSNKELVPNNTGRVSYFKLF